MSTGDKKKKSRRRTFCRRAGGFLCALLLCAGIFSPAVSAMGENTGGETEETQAQTQSARTETEKEKKSQASETETQRETKSKASETETETKSQSQSETETQTESETGIETETETESESETEKDQIILSCSGKGYQIKVTAGAQTGISKDCTLTAEEIKPDSDEYEELSDRCQAALDRFEKDGTAQIPREKINSDAKKLKKQEKASEKEAEEGGPVTVKTGKQTLRAFDITILDKDKKEIEPDAPVQVEISLDSLKGLDKEDDLTVVHDGDKKTDVLTGSDLKTDLKKDTAKGGKLSFQLDSFSTVAVTYYGNNYKVMIDPTNGGFPVTHSNGTTTLDGVYYYNGAALKNYNLNVTKWDTAYFQLPDANQVESPSGYKYRLNGWYNVDKKEWAAPGSWVDASYYNGTTFYADWVPASYNVGSSSGAIDTKNYPFISGKVFDYNDLYNARSCTFTSNGQVGDNRTIEWKQGSEPVFFDTKGRKGTLMQVNGRKSDSSSQNYATQGLADRLIPNLFIPERAWNTVNGDGTSNAVNENGVPGVTYVGDANNLFQYGKDKEGHDGYYYYDSTRNASSYNRKDNRFYVYGYKYKEETAASDNGDKSDFLPFNSGAAKYGNDGKSGGFQVNYWFGMSTSVDFYLPNDVGQKDSSGKYGNKSEYGDDMVYKFSGDDDVWVYVDDQLVLDMGGVHGVVNGEINFSTGKVSITNGGTQTSYSIPDITGITSGEHTLRMYYMERGGSESNCSIYFNLAPRYSLTLAKQDKDTNANLQGAMFGVYTDEGCTIPASLWVTGDQSETKINQFTTDGNGQINCSGLCAGNTYYLKELKPPASGYPDISDAVIKLVIDNSGHAVVSTLSGDDSWLVSDGNGQISSEDNDSSKGTFHLSLLVKNKKTTKVKIEKYWKDSQGNDIKDKSGLTASFELWRKTTPKDTPDVNQTHTVTFRTQYFVESANGTNRDSGLFISIKQGPESTVTVHDGSSLPFTVKAFGENGNMGIYSVLAGGEQLSGTMSDSTQGSSQFFLVGGKWIPLYRQGAYQLDNITKDTVVTVTYIGYLQYDGNTPSFAKSYSIDAGQEIAGTTSTPSQPQQGVDEKVPNVPAATLKDGNWSYLWKDLPVQDSNGNTYYYYVKEVSVPAGFEVSIDNNGGISGGTITATNTKQTTQISVEKAWNDHDDIKHIRPASVEISLYKDGKDTGQTLTLSQDNDWKGSFTGLDKYEAGSDGKAVLIEYTVKEKAVKGYTSYISPSGTDQWLVTNSLLYELPDTGRPGNYPLIFCGCALIGGALSLYRKDRKNKTPKGL